MMKEADWPADTLDNDARTLRFTSRIPPVGAGRTKLVFLASGRTKKPVEKGSNNSHDAGPWKRST
jgi:hypothetical protein